MPDINIDELLAGLVAIAEGYPVQGEHDRWIVVENPKAAGGGMELEGEYPNIVIDTELASTFFSRRARMEALLPKVVEALEPFAEMLASFRDDDGFLGADERIWDAPTHVLTLGDVWRFRALLTQLKALT